MTAIGKNREDRMISLRMTTEFKAGMEKATVKSGLPSYAEFIKQAIIEKAAKHGVKISRLK